MKKTLFDYWYVNVGRSVAEKLVSRKTNTDIRNMAKLIFDSVYKMTKESYDKRLSFVCEDLNQHVQVLKESVKKYGKAIKDMSTKKWQITKVMTDLYDAYYKHDIPKKVFENQKAYLASELDKCSEIIALNERFIKMAKEEIRSVESLIVADY